ncbi:hypothetical protein BKA69DRAFT_1107064 [Paraphysoderma sedebokerense]|nr:hypothetical protein BKA69DRAFT_1107064 [Paraphysoderma sedebokerense]
MNSDDERVFVRRKPKASVASDVTEEEESGNFLKVLGVTDNVVPRESFWLNVIAQLPCYITVSTCSRKPSSLLSDSDSNHAASTTVEEASSESPFVLNPLQSTTKRVYATPYEQRMDTNKSSHCACSYPIVFFCVNDYMDCFESAIIKETEHLCIEVSCLIEKSPHFANRTSVPSTLIAEQSSSLSSTIPSTPTAHPLRKSSSIQSITNNHTTDTGVIFPFDNDSYHKIVLFQGTASFESIVDVYSSKQQQKQSMIQWLSKSEDKTTEFVSMVGPHGIGRAQVAVTPVAHSLTSSPKQAPSPSSSSSTPASPLKKLLMNLSPSTSHSSRPESLQCCLTFVNMDWRYIAKNLLKFITSIDKVG